MTIETCTHVTCEDVNRIMDEADRLREQVRILGAALSNIAAGFGCEECTTLAQCQGAMAAAESIAVTAITNANKVEV